MFEQNIQKGVEFLDQNYPNWLDKVDVSELDLSDCHQCIMGQLFGHYIKGKRKYGGEKMKKFGFSVEIGLLSDKQFEQLTEEWKQAIKHKKQIT